MRVPAKTVLTSLASILMASGLSRGGQQVSIYVADLDTNIQGENRSVAISLSDAIETALIRRRTSFKLLERRKYNEIIRSNKLEKDLQALAQGRQASPRLTEQLKGADAVVSGELKDSHVDGVVLTIALTRLDSEKIWQARRKHSLLEWLSNDVQEKEAESLAADAASTLLPAALPLPEMEDGPRGIALAKEGKCPEALPLLRNAAAIDTTNAEIFFHVGRCDNEAGEFQDATRYLTSAIARNPRRADLFAERARSFMRQSQTFRALEDIDQAVGLDSRNLDVLELRGDILMKAGRYDAAVGAYDAVYQERPNRTACVKLVEAQRSNGATGAATKLERACASFR